MNSEDKQAKRIWLRGFRYSFALFPSMALLSVILMSIFPESQSSLVTLGFTLVLTTLLATSVFAFRHKRKMANNELYWISGFCSIWLGLGNYLVLTFSENSNKAPEIVNLAIAFAIALVSFGIFILGYKRNTEWMFRLLIKNEPPVQSDDSSNSANASDNKSEIESDMYAWLSKIEQSKHFDAFHSAGHSLESVLKMNYSEVHLIVNNEEDSNRIFLHIMRNPISPK